MKAVVKIADRFASQDGTFLRVFDSKKSPHIFPRYSTENLVIQEVSYNLSIRLSTTLHKKKKAPWPTLPMKIGLYEIKNLKFVDTE